MSATTEQAPLTIQARRIFLIARLLTAGTWLAAVAVHVAVIAYTWLTPAREDISCGHLLVDLSLWIAVFTFWFTVAAAQRHKLRLHRRC